MYMYIHISIVIVSIFKGLQTLNVHIKLFFEFIYKVHTERVFGFNGSKN